ncbi:sigma-70 family RNA polymerase sigma factor [Tepidibacillus marianensis]|uniref:RNA polymerase sigma factor n=1 Tax=Tepidibacillus marianensis TaxID=3131995 RepID=UPI0030D2FB12
MKPTFIDINNNIEVALKKYSDMVRRICFLYLHNSADADDVFQEVFLKLLQKKTSFESAEHEKAWVIRVAINKCKDVLKSFWRKNIDSIENMEIPFEDKAENELMHVVLSLPNKYKDVIYLYYYEEYNVPEISKLLKKNENTIYSHLHRARVLIKQKLGGKQYDYSF